jgi:addiction module RelE/StbE family toxin
VCSIVAPEQYLRQARKFLKRHPDLKPRFSQVISDLQQDPLGSGLELHPLRGRLEGCYAIRLTHSTRITLTLAIPEKEIILLDIGSHDEVYR